VPMSFYVQSPRGRQALAYVHCARRKIENGEDAIPELGAAITALRIEAGELPPDELDIEARPDE
jgi:hypothetical protein